MPNALVHEKSPYLLQHAENPVDWLPWGEVAFAKARAEQKPIFLSIGYATCHWCHVMAHESFEDDGVAELLNRSFVAIKVDREERPDVDKVYMTYVQAMTGHGGWPLSAWLTPELKPFFGGTYFPPEDRSGRAGFRSLLRAIAKGWTDERDKLVGEGERVIGTLREHLQSRANSDLKENVVVGGLETERSLLDAQLFESGGAAFEKCFQYFYEAFDPQNAGFGGAPKFPRASNLNFLFRVAALQGATSEIGAEAIKLATATCRAMAHGGIHDHVGGGYHRYAVDERWFVPHFEKMLYDQAQIAINALEAKQATGDARYAWMAHDVFGYVLRDLQHPDGGFYSAEDADSVLVAGKPEHAEGAFYVWSDDEFAAVLGGDAPMGAAHFGVAAEGNVPSELDPQEEFRGQNILMQRQSIAATARAFGSSVEQTSERLVAALGKLRSARERRPRPLRDDKIITAWNGLMISALAKAHQVLGDGGANDGAGAPDPQGGPYLRAATRAADFLERELYDSQRGVLFRSWRQGRGMTEAFAEDYACLIQGLLDLYEAGFEIRWLQWAVRLQATMDERFWDDANGGYFNSQATDPNIVLRLKEDYDGAEPAASSVAAMNLGRLAAIFDHESVVTANSEQPRESPALPQKLTYRERAQRTLTAFRTQWTQTPQALPQMLCALELVIDSPRHVVLAGDPRAADFRALAAIVHERLGARRALLAADGGEGQHWLAKRAAWLAEMQPIGRRATAYVCEEFACQAPVTTPEELKRLLFPATEPAAKSEPGV